MQKKIVVFLLLFSLLIPNVAFAGEDVTVNDDVGELQLQTDVIQENDSEYESSSVDENAVDDEKEGEIEKEEVTEEPISEESEVELLPAQMENGLVTVKGVNSCKFEWDYVEFVKVHIKCTYGDVEKNTTTTSDSYTVSNIPFGETVTVELTTDDKHEPFIMKCNPSEESKPVKIEFAESKECKDNYKTVYDYCSDVKIMSKSGAKISSSNYSLSCSKDIKGPGVYTINVTFKNTYSNYKPMTFKLKLVPSTPYVVYFFEFQTQTSLKFMAHSYNNDYDKFQIQLSKNKDYSKPITKTVKGASAGKLVTITMTGLSKNTHYYARVRTYKTVGGTNYYSKWFEKDMHTVSPMPAYSFNQKYVKEIIAQMKKNKNFDYTFNGHYNYSELIEWVGAISDDFPQYASKYSRSVSFKNGKITLNYMINKSRINECKQLEKAINSIAKKAKKKKGTKAKIRYINQRMCKICRYDYDTYRKTKKYNSDAYTAHGCLVRGKAVCSGYAKAFRAVAAQCGIKSTYGRGKNHIWNKVKIGKTWYHIDVTWNDCTHSTRWLLKKSHKG